MLSITIVSILILAFAFRPYERALLGLVEHISARNRNLALFMLIIFVVPLILLLL
jgi:hypothetical protein